MAQSPSAAAPQPNEQPPEAGPVTEYPNYGGEVDCEAGTFNGLEYAGLIKKISAPDDGTVVFELCAPDPASWLGSRSPRTPSTTPTTC